MICICCGNAITYIQKDVPGCVNVIKLEIQNQIGQKTAYEAPNCWLCHDCNTRIANNIANNSRNVMLELPEPATES